MTPLPGAADGSRRLRLVLLLLVVLPLLFYSAFEIASLSESESLMRDMYRRQLDAILFSVNQHAWDVSSRWAVMLDAEMIAQGSAGAAARSILAQVAALDAVVLADPGLQTLTIALGDSARPGAITAEGVRSVLAPAADRLAALQRFQRAEYRKLEPFILPPAAGNDACLLIVFAVGEPGSAVTLAGFAIRERPFIDRVLSAKITDAAAGEFIVGVFRRGADRPLLQAGGAAPGQEFQRRDLWLSPGLELGIRLAGTTVDEAVRVRFRRNIIILILLDLLLLAGALLIHRSVKAQTEFAKAKAAFVSNVSHELRTPLALIRMYAETLEMGRLKEDGKKQEYYRTILRETDRLSHLVNTILNFSRMEAGKRPYRMRPVDLHTVLHGVLETYRLHLEQQGVVPDLRLAPGPALAGVDADAVTEAMINLIDNAVKYGGPAKYLGIRTSVDADRVTVAFEDRGIGIAPEHRKRIFDVFYRVPSGLVHETKGSGLGLSLVQHIMNAHNGSVEVESTPGKGSIFRLVFPRAGTTAVHEQQTSQQE